MTKFSFSISEQSGTIKRTIEEITGEDAKTRESLGIAKGQDIGHCLDISIRHCGKTDEFIHEVKYYRVLPAQEKYPYIVEFYR